MKKALIISLLAWLMQPTPDLLGQAPGTAGSPLAALARSTPAPDPSPAPANNCDQTLWQHVYKPQRLIIHDPCISVTGTIVDATAGKRRDGVRHEGDGDTHGWLAVDPIFKGLLNDGNLNDENGNLVYEVICRYPVKQADAQSSCANYRNAIKLAPVGCQVRITGSFVQDKEHAKWNEIHPVSNIEVLSCPKGPKGQP